mmetsp:Transcript_19225/g.44115  ORF Transcript_19225/g.44115 Transcript_19225/m.44115 type:complete len:296 (+) Transcript_19225:888-1775(+)
MMERSMTTSDGQRRTRTDRVPHKHLRSRHGLDHAHTLREPCSDAGGKGAASPVRVFRVNLPGREDVAFTGGAAVEDVRDHLAPFHVPALDHHPAGAQESEISSCYEHVLSCAGNFPVKQRHSLGEIRGYDLSEGKEKFLDLVNCLSVYKLVPAGRNHDGVDHPLHDPSPPNRTHCCFHNAGRGQHARLDHIGSDVLQADFDLLAQEGGGHRLYCCHSSRVLSCERGNGRHAVGSQRLAGLDVCLDASASSAVRSCDDQHPGYLGAPHGHASQFALQQKVKLFLVFKGDGGGGEVV